MRQSKHAACIFAAVAMLGGCEPSDPGPGPTAMTVEEGQALNEAAEMLDERRLPQTRTEPPSTQATRPPDEAATR
ncbi:MAG TPA: hypothetical protein VLA37_12605 [Sphingomonadaceae bacterium]|nr:hypothetical protein [Sphingomonadaceae bacterium]